MEISNISIQGIYYSLEREELSIILYDIPLNVSLREETSTQQFVQSSMMFEREVSIGIYLDLITNLIGLKIQKHCKIQKDN